MLGKSNTGILNRFLNVWSTFMETEYEITDRIVSFQSPTYVQALNGGIANGRYQCNLTTGNEIERGVQYDPREFSNCSTVEGGFSAGSLSSTYNLDTVYALSGYNGRCQVFFGILPTQPVAPLAADALSVGGRVFIRLGNAGCFSDSTCNATSLIGNCDASLGQESTVPFSPLDFQFVDLDGSANTALEFAIVSGNDAGYFSINTATGQLSLGSTLDRDTGPGRFSIAVEISDGLFASTYNISVLILDQNDNAPMPSMPAFSASIPEGSPPQTPVLNVTFTDADISDNAMLEYRLQSAYFVIDNVTGEVSTAREFDYEQGDLSYSFVVTATDSGQVPLSGSVEVTVTIEDVNDNRPSANGSLVDGAVFVEGGEAVRVADIVVSDDDTDFDLVFATIEITDAVDINESMIVTVPDGIKTGYLDSSLYIAGRINASQMSSILQSALYNNTADEMTPPLNRTIVYSVCDQFVGNNVPLSLSQDTRSALSTGTALDPTLPIFDIAILSTSCTELVSFTFVLPLIAVNDRPVLAEDQVYFQNVSEDIPDEENRGEVVGIVFRDAVEDSDAEGFVGVALIGHFSSADPELGIPATSSFCSDRHSEYSSCVSISGVQVGPEAKKFKIWKCQELTNTMKFWFIKTNRQLVRSCPRPPPFGRRRRQTTGGIEDVDFSSVSQVQLILGTVSTVDLTSLYVDDTNIDFDFSVEEFDAFSGANGTYTLTYNDSSSINIPLDPVVINYTSVGDVSETSALVAGPYNLIRFVPLAHAVGPTTLGFKGWDGSDGISSGTSNVDTTAAGATSFSTETGNATIYVTSVNDPPEIELGGPGVTHYTTTYTEGGNPVGIAATNSRVLERDANDVELSYLEITVSKEDGTCDLPEYGRSNDNLILPSQLASFNFTSITLLGDACATYTSDRTQTIDIWTAIIRMTKFEVLDAEPSDHRRRLEFVISDEFSTSLPSYTFINVELVSDICPVLQLSPTTLLYTEHSGSLTLDPTLNVTDDDRNPQIQRVTVSISSSIQCDKCILKSSISNEEITVSYNNQSQMLTLEGPASPSTFQTLLRGIQFEDEGDEPAVNLLTVQIMLIDPATSPCLDATGFISIIIEHVNDNSPVIFLDWPYDQHFTTTFTEGNLPISVTGGDVMINEKDSEQSASYTVFISVSGCVSSEDSLAFASSGGSTVSLPYDSDNCSLELTGSISRLEIDTELLRYTNSLTENPTEGTRTINFTIADANNPVTTSFSYVIVVAVNDPPEVYLSEDSTDLMVEFQLGGDSVSVTDDGTIIDHDNAQLQSMSISLIEYGSSSTELISPSDGVFEGIEIDLDDSTTQQLGLVYTKQTTTQLTINGSSSLSEYTTVLNSIIYFNRKIPPTLNRREVRVVVSDGEDESAAAVAMISFVGALDPPVVDLNGGESGRDSSITYTSATAGVLLFPSGTITDPNGDQICRLEVTLTGNQEICPPESLSFTSGGSDIELTESAESGDTTLFTVTSTLECRNNDIFQNILQGIVFQSNGEPGNCTLSIVAQDEATLNSTAVEGRVEVVAYNDPPFVDLNLGYVGRDYSTVYYQGGQIRHIVSIYNATTSHNISTFTLIGEADGEAAVDGLVNGGGVFEDQSNAGYRVTDSDSNSLTYLQVEFIKSSNPDNDVIRYPCKPLNTSATTDPRGCTRAGESILVSDLECDDDVFEACSAAYDLCTGLQIRIFCSTSARKGYRFVYPASSSSVKRYEALLGYLGYEYLLTDGGSLNQVRQIDVSVSDGENTNLPAITRVKPLHFGLTIPTGPALRFIVYEDERPERIVSVFTVPVETVDGFPPEEGSVLFQIISGNEDGKFRIDSITGEIFLQEMVDREERAEYRLQVSAQFIDDPEEETGATAEIVAEVIDINDEHPLVQESFKLNVTEGTANFFVVDLNATDADEGINAELMYLLLGIGVENFYVTDSGIVRTRNRLNVTEEDFYLLVAIVFDMGFPSLSAHSVLHINVITPLPTNLSFVPETVDTPAFVSESQDIGYIFHTVQAYEVGGTGDTAFITYEILSIDPQETSQPFAINSTTGDLYVNAPLDSEINSIYQVQLKTFSVKSVFRPSPDEATLEVNVRDANEHAPVFSLPFDFTVAENSQNGVIVGTVTANDPDDMNTGITYSLASIPPGLPFNVRSNGNIVVAGAIDYESVTTFSFTVLALDIPAHGQPPMTGSAEITVDVLDRNDNLPQFVDTPYDALIFETADLNTVVVSFNTTDSDTPENSAVSYSSPDISTTPFCIDSTTIIVCDASQLTTIETPTTFVIGLVATNPPAVSGDMTQTATESVAISLILVNEFDPVFPDNDVVAPPLYEEHCGLGFSVGNCIGFEVYDINATDADGGPSGTIEYSLLTQGVPFEVNSITGELTITGRIDREFQEVYLLQVRAEDGADSDGTVRSARANITITFLDIDDNAPVIIRPFEFVVTENITRTVSPFGSVQITDPDITGTHEYTMMIPNVENSLEGCVVNDPSGVFLPIAIDTQSGELYFCEPVDYETQPTVFTFNVRVSDTGSLGPNSGTITHISDPVVMTVTVVDFNDHAPDIERDPYTVSVEENIASGTVVGEVMATDEDSGEFGNLQFSLLFNGSSTCSEELPFVVVKTSSSTADIQTCLTLDYEQRIMYNFELVVCDNASVPMCDYAQVAVSVLDLNDHYPLFTAPTYTAVIAETDSSLQEGSVTTVAVTDADSPPNSVSNFSIVPSNTPFSLRAETSLTVEVYVTQPGLIDYDSGLREFIFTVVATNEPSIATDVTLISTATIRVNVTDVNDNAPIISRPYVFDIRENKIAGTEVGCISASDNDDGINAVLSYSIVNESGAVNCSDDDIPFSIDSFGCLTSCDAFDYESIMSYRLRVIVCDAGSPMLCTEREITVNVTDLNDNPLVYTQDPFFVDLPECAIADQELLVVTFTDEDSDRNSIATFEFLNTTSPFYLQESWIIYTAVEELDYENGPRTYILHVRGTNPSAIVGDTTWIVDVVVTVNIVDCNDNPPVFDPVEDTVVIPEHDSSFTYTLATTDNDTAPNSLVSYAIVEPSPFSIVGSTIQASNSAAIDFDPPNNISQYILTIMSTNPPASEDDVMQTANFTLIINVTDINDNAPQCDSRDSFSVLENASISVSIRRYRANDIDSGENGNSGLIYDINDSGAPGSGDILCTFEDPFRIYPESGYIYPCVPLDFETQDTYRINITVRDSGSPQMVTVCPVVVTILDANDNVPVLNPPTAFSVGETAPLSTEVGCINGTDADSEENGEIVYTFEEPQCSMDNPFEIDASSGCISVCHTLDFETDTAYNLTVVLTDSAYPFHSTSGTVRISVVNENDHPPVITSSSIAYVIEEQANAVVITVEVEDLDAPPFNVVTLSLPDDAGGLFAINSSTGTIRTTEALDREEEMFYNVTVTVSDGFFSSTQRMTIILIDINDNLPIYQGSDTYYFMEEILFTLVLVYNDEDSMNNSLHSFSATHTNFSIDSMGNLSNLVPLDRDPATGGQPIISLTIRVTDGSNSVETHITIRLFDINDNAPVPQAPFRADIFDGTEAGTTVLTVTATDADSGDNAELRYTIDGTSSFFDIDANSGNVTAIRNITLSSDMSQELILTVAIRDNGVNQQTTYQNYTFTIVNVVPRFLQDLYEFNINENDLGGVIDTITAMDRDTNTANDVFVYMILSVTPYDSGFRIESEGASGTLYSPRNYFDFEDSVQFELRIAVSRENLTIIDDETIVRVIVDDRNDNPPRLSPLNVKAEVPEDIAIGETVLTAVGIDFDRGSNGILSYNHSGAGEEAFEFDSNGNLKVVDVEIIDYELVSSFVFRYQACDSGNPQLCSESGIINITITNVDDIPPVFNPNTYSITISEDFEQNREVLSVDYGDEDTPLTNVILSLSPPQTLFEIAQVSGTLMTTNIPLDRETTAVHVFYVVANDSSSQSSSALVTITLSDVNDVRPYVEPLESTASFTEGAGPALIAPTLSVVDHDDVSIYPLRSIDISLHPSLQSTESYPLTGGICDHANYSLFYDENVYTMCGFAEEPCLYLLDPERVVVSTGGALTDKILTTGSSQGFAGNTRLFSGADFNTFSVSLWLRLDSPTASGSILELRTTQDIELNLQVDAVAEGTGTLTLLSRTQTLLTTGPLDTHDTAWHHITLVRDEEYFTIYFDGIEEAHDNTSRQFDDSFSATTSFLFGTGLETEYLSEVYLCFSNISKNDVQCALTCGESFEMQGDTIDVAASIDLRARSINLEYTGSNNANSLTQLQEALQKVLFRYDTNIEEPNPLQRGIFVRVLDIVGTSDERGVITLVADLVNDQKPVLDLNGFSEDGIDYATTFEELSDGVEIIGSDAVLYDEDSGLSTVGRIVIEILLPRTTEEIFATGTVEGLRITQESSSRIVIDSSTSVEHYPGQYLDALRSLRYRNLQDEPVQTSREIQFTVYDMGLTFVNVPFVTTHVTVVPTNDRPVLDLDSFSSSTRNTSLAFYEEEGQVRLLTGTAQSIIDPDSVQVIQAVVKFTLRPDGESETLQLDSSGLSTMVSAIFESDSGTLTLDGAYSFNEWLELLRRVEYVNTYGDPDENIVRQVSMQVVDDGGAISEPAYAIISVVPFNNPPVIYLGGPKVQNFHTVFVEDGPCISIANLTMEIVDVDSDTIEFARTTLQTVNADLTYETIETTSGGPNGRYIESSDSRFIFITLQDPSLENFALALPTIMYCNSEDEPDDGTRQIEVAVRDTGSSFLSAYSYTFIDIQHVNDQPSLQVESLNNISIRGVPTIILDKDSIVLEDSDDDRFLVLYIFITNAQDGVESETIIFDTSLPANTTSLGSLVTDDGILNNVTFRAGGADANQVIETIANVRYRNTAANLTVDPPRNICLQVADQSLYFSELVCVSVILSPPNFFSPVITSFFSEFTLSERNDSVPLATVVAEDDDTDLAGQIEFSIPQVLSTPQGGSAKDTTSSNIFGVDPASGGFSAPDGLDAEAYKQHIVTVRASDMGNPIRFDEIEIQITVTDENDNAPVFSDGPYTLPSVTEAQLSFGVVGSVTAEDDDLTSPNNDIVSYYLVTQDSRFSIDNSGQITYTEELDADVGDPNIVLTVSATDGGTPSLTGYTTVSFTIGEINDYEARVDQVSPALYVVDVPALPQSIGPAMRVDDIDLSVSTITSVVVKLTLNEVDRDRGYSTCLAICQPERIQAAGLTTSLDLFELPSPGDIFLTDDGNTNNLQFLEISDTMCDSVRMTRGDVRESDGYGQIARSELPNDFLSGDFSVSFVAKVQNEGFVVIVPDQTNRSLGPSDVNRDFGIWLRRRDLLFSYVYGPNSEQETIDLNLPGGVEFFDPAVSLDEAETQHYTVVVNSATSELKVYINCELRLIGSLMGQVVVPNPESDVFIGQSRPSPVNAGRLGAEMHGLYYHPTALSKEQIESFCSCGLETLMLPSSIPSSISADRTITSTDVTISLSPTQSNIPEDDLVTFLRGIRYENTFNPPTFDPVRPLEFTVEEDNNEDTAVTTGSITLVSSDTTLPEIDLNGPLVGGIDYSVDFTENGGAIAVSNDVRLTRMVPSPAIATFDLIEITFNNGVDADEYLSVTTTNPFITVIGSGTTSITIEGPGDSSDFLNALKTVTYQNTNNRPTTNFERTIEFTVTDTKGDTNNPIAIASVRVIAVNDAPQLTLSGNGDTMHNVEYNEGSQNGVILAPDISTVDVDNDVLQTARVALTSPRLTSDKLVIDNIPSGLTSDYDTSSGILTITGPASSSTFEEALRNITFESTDSPFLDNSGNPISPTDRTVTFTVSDGIDDSVPVTVHIEFLPVDDPPIILGVPDMMTFTEGDPPINIAPMVILKDDDNDHLMSLQVDLLAPLSGDVLSDGTTSSNLLRFDLRTLSEFQNILRTITYVSTADEPSLNNRTINVEVCDFNACDRVTVIINVEDYNDNTPVFGSAAYEFEVTEDIEVGATIGTIMVSDRDDRDSHSTRFLYRTEPTVLPFRFERIGTAEDRLEIIVDEELDAEIETLHGFRIFASDEVNEGSTNITVNVQNINEAPTISLETSATIVGSPNSETQLLQVGFSITDQDLGDSVLQAQLIVRNIPFGSAETLVYFPDADNVTFTGTANEYLLELTSDANVTLEDALRDIYYEAGSEVMETTLFRSVDITVFDAGGLESEPVEVTVSLASIPLFTLSIYSLSLTEGILHTDFFQVIATVESGGDTIDYAIEQNVGVDINPSTGYLSLTQLLDREAGTTKSFDVFAVDNLPPARTGTATVTITILDANDVRPNVTINQPTITIFTGVPVLLLPNVTVSDPDILSNILQATITVVGQTELTTSPFTGEVCVDNHQILQKMEETCGLENYTDALSSREGTGAGATLALDDNNNVYLNNTGSGYVNITATDFSFLTGNISELTTAFWFRPETSGYVLYAGRKDPIERYYAIYFDKDQNQIIVTFKRAGVTGLEAQVRVIFQVLSPLCDENWHFVMIQYNNRELVCAVDAALVGSQAVVFKEQPYIGEVYGEFVLALHVSQMSHTCISEPRGSELSPLSAPKAF